MSNFLDFLFILRFLLLCTFRILLLRTVGVLLRARLDGDGAIFSSTETVWFIPNYKVDRLMKGNLAIKPNVPWIGDRDRSGVVNHPVSVPHSLDRVVVKLVV